MEIKVCPNNHHFVEKENCPFCGEKAVKTIKAQKGDCIACGQLCPAYAYGCNVPDEFKDRDMFIIK
jgi:ribosomal protein L37AE/L43A